MAFSNVSAKPLRLRTLILKPLPSTNLFHFGPANFTNSASMPYNSTVGSGTDRSPLRSRNLYLL